MRNRILDLNSDQDRLGSYYIIKQLRRTPPEEDLTLPDYEELIKQFNKIGYKQVGVLDDNGKIIGVAGYTIEPNLHMPKLLYLRHLVVDAPHRNNNIGKELIKVIDEIAQAEGCEATSLVAFKSNVGARDFYERNDFEVDCLNFKKNYRKLKERDAKGTNNERSNETITASASVSFWSRSNRNHRVHITIHYDDTLENIRAKL